MRWLTLGLILATRALVWAASAPHWEPLGEPGCGGWLTAISVSPHDAKRVLLGGDLLGLGLSLDGGDHWLPTFGLKSWEIGDFNWLRTEPLTVWAGTVSGPYVSLDGGLNWQERRQGFPPIEEWSYSAPIEDVLFDPTNMERLLAFGGSSRNWETPTGSPRWGAVWESLDAGESWQLLTTLTPEGATTDPEARGVNLPDATFGAGPTFRLYVVMRGVGLWSSEDGGQTWQRRDEGLPAGSLERVIADPSDPDKLWVAANRFKLEGEANWRPGGIYKSTDSGQTWAEASEGLSQRSCPEEVLASGFKALSACASIPEVMVTGDLSYWTNGVFVSRDGGASWRGVASKARFSPDDVDRESRKLAGAFVPETAYFAGLNATCSCIAPNDANTLYVAGSEYVLRSRDGGTTWEDVTSERIKQSWRGRGYSGLCATNFHFDPRKRGRSFLQAMDVGRAWISEDGLHSWRYCSTDPSPWNAGNDVAFAGTDGVYLSTGQFGSGGAVLRSKDLVQFEYLAGPENGLPSPSGQGEAQGIYCLPDRPEYVWVIFGGELYASDDSGDHWRPVEGLSGKLGWIVADPKKPERFFISGDLTCWLTEDGGVTFTPIGGPQVAGRVTCDSLGRFYVAAWRGKRAGLWRWEEASGWRRLWDEYYLAGVAVDPKDPDRIAVIDDDNPFHDICYARGVWLSADGGATWGPANEGLSVTRGPALAYDPFDPEQLVVGTEGRGYWKARWAKDWQPEGIESYNSTPEDAVFAAWKPAGG